MYSINGTYHKSKHIIEGFTNTSGPGDRGVTITDITSITSDDIAIDATPPPIVNASWLSKATEVNNKCIGNEDTLEKLNRYSIYDGPKTKETKPNLVNRNWDINTLNNHCSFLSDDLCVSDIGANKITSSDGGQFPGTGNPWCSLSNVNTPTTIDKNEQKGEYILSEKKTDNVNTPTTIDAVPKLSKPEYVTKDEPNKYIRKLEKKLNLTIGDDNKNVIISPDGFEFNRDGMKINIDPVEMNGKIEGLNKLVQMFNFKDDKLKISGQNGPITGLILGDKEQIHINKNSIGFTKNGKDTETYITPIGIETGYINTIGSVNAAKVRATGSITSPLFETTYSEWGKEGKKKQVKTTITPTSIIYKNKNNKNLSTNIGPYHVNSHVTGGNSRANGYYDITGKFHRKSRKKINRRKK